MLQLQWNELCPGGIARMVAAIFMGLTEGKQVLIAAYDGGTAFESVGAS